MGDKTVKSQNESIRRVQELLMKELKKLNDSLDDVTDFKQAQAIVREMQEVNHRIAIAGGVLFAAQAQELDEKVPALNKAAKKVEEALKDLKKLEQVLLAVSAFLGLVDEVLDLAKATI